MAVVLKRGAIMAAETCWVLRFVINAPPLGFRDGEAVQELLRWLQAKRLSPRTGVILPWLGLLASGLFAL